MTIKQCVRQCLKKFQEGCAIQLYNDCASAVSLFPEELEAKADSSSQVPAAAAKSIADQDNYSGALKLLLHDSPPGYISDLTTGLINDLYLTRGADGHIPIIQHPTINKVGTCLNCSHNKLIQQFQKIKTGKGSGPFADVTDVLQNMAF
eukprot:967257-Ditylum_brightwellii.AAC.1